MPTIEKVLKAEIQRLAKKEIKAATADLRKHASAHRGSIADLRRRLAQLEKENKSLLKKAADAQKDETEPNKKDDGIEKARITAKMIKSMRKRLGLSQAQLAKLIGVNQQSVYQWEKKEGQLSFRGDAKGKIVAARAMTKKEAAAKLEKT